MPWSKWSNTSDDVRVPVTYGFDWDAPVIGELILDRQALERHVRQATKNWDPDTQHWSALARGALGPNMSDALRREIERPKFERMSDDEFLSQAVKPDGLRLLSQETFLNRLQRWLADDDKANLRRLKQVFRRPAGRRSRTSKRQVQESYRSTYAEIGPVHAMLRNRRNAASAVLPVQERYPALYTRIVRAGLKEEWFPVTASQNERIVTRREHMAAKLVGLEQDLEPSTVLKYAQQRPKESTRN
jgi:hypothetical protein